MKTSDVITCVNFLYKLKLKLFSKEVNKIVNCTNNNKIDMLKEIYKRLLVPFYIPILMLVPYLIVLSSKEKTNYSKLKIITFLLGTLIIIFSEGIIRFVSQELIDNLFIFLSPLIIFLFLYFIFIFKLNYKH